MKLALPSLPAAELPLPWQPGALDHGMRPAAQKKSVQTGRRQQREAWLNLPEAAFHADPRSSTVLLEQVARHLESCMAKGIFPPGAKLPGERVLAHRFGVSRNTISAAHQLLETRGLIRCLPHRGAFVCRRELHSSSISWSEKISRHAHLLDEPVLELLARSRLAPPAYPLSAGTPYLPCFPAAEFRKAILRVLDEQPMDALRIAPTEGQPALRQAIAAFDRVETSRVMILAGAQEGIDLIARCLIEPGDYVVVDRPTFPGAIQALRSAGARLVQWEAGRWEPDELERLLIAHRPKLIFTMPTFHNPTGLTMRLEQREALLALAGRYGVPIIEDDVYSRSRLQGTEPKSLRELDQQNVVIYLSTFSKILAPGLRLGWLVAPTHMVKQLSLIKMRASLFTEGLQQLALATMLREGQVQAHLHRLRDAHRLQRDTALHALEQHFPATALQWTKPHGGLYLWCRARGHADLESALLRAEKLGVVVAPGRAFYAEHPDEDYFRICFTACERHALQESIRILAESLSARV